MRKATFVVAVIVLLGAGACSSEKGIRTTLDEYSIRLSQSSAPPGPQAFSVSNRGEIAHQFLVLRTNDRPDDLPVGKDGVVKVDAKGIDLAGEIELLTPGGREPFAITLRPGRYALICNIAGHYASGMRTGFVAT